MSGLAIFVTGLFALCSAANHVDRGLSGPAACKELQIPVTASAQNFVFPPLGNLSDPEALETLLNATTQISSDSPRITRGGQFQISGRYCPPAAQASHDHEDTIELLVHGLSYTKEYWSSGSWSARDATAYSWVKSANQRGYATLEIDRLGNGQSSLPDPADYNQLPLQAEVIHQVVQQLTAGKIEHKRFANVVGVGHSWGSILLDWVVQEHPEDFPAVVLTGFSSDLSGAPAAIGDLAFQVAKDILPQYAYLPQGYLAGTSADGVASAFYAGNYDHGIPPLDFMTRGVASVGELILFEVPAPAYRGRVFDVTGDRDLPNCGTVTPGNCLPVSNSTVARTGAQFPNAASFDYYVPPDTAHDLNFHYTAVSTYAAVHNWLDKYF